MAQENYHHRHRQRGNVREVSKRLWLYGNYYAAMLLVLTQQRRSTSENLGGAITMAMSSNSTWVLDLYFGCALNAGTTTDWFSSSVRQKISKYFKLVQNLESCRYILVPTWKNFLPVWFLNVGEQRNINSLTSKSILVGTKNSRLEGFWLAKHKHTNIPTMMGPFPPVAWFCRLSWPHPRAPLRKGSAKVDFEGFGIKL